MGTFFVRLYRFFAGHKALLWTLLGVTSTLFLALALQMQYEEDISKLVPATEDSDSGLAFNSLRVKDKIYLQFVPEEGLPEAELLSTVDSFMEQLAAADSTDRAIDNVLYRLEADLALTALDYGLSHLPVFVSPDTYPAFEEAIGRSDETMARNREALMADETGRDTQMITLDPLGLRSIILPEGLLGETGYAYRSGHLFATGGNTALAFLSPTFSYQNSQESDRLVRKIEAQIKEYAQSAPRVTILLHGAPVRSVGNSRTIKQDLVFTIGISFLLILLLLCLCFKSVRILWQNLLPVAYGTAFALAVMFLLKGTMSLMAFGICAIVLGVALSYSLHVIIHHRFVGSVEQLLRDEATPVCLGCLTTVGAFLGLLFTKSDLLRDFGIFASLALVGSTAFTLIFLPHLLEEGNTRRSSRVLRLVDRVNSVPYDKNPVFLCLLTAFVAVGVALSGRVRFDSDLRHIGYDSPQMLAAQERFARENLDGLAQRYYAAVGATLDEALESHRAVRDAIDSLLERGAAVKSPDLTSRLFLTRAEQQRRIDAWNAWWADGHLEQARTAITAAARRQGLSPSLFDPFFALAEAEYTPSSLYESGIVPEGLLCNYIESSGGRYLVFSPVQMEPGNQKAVDDAIAAVPHAVVIDPIYYTGNLVELIHRDFDAALLISSLFVLLVLLLSFRNLWTALLAFLPMALSWYVVQGYMALFSLEFNLINIVISTFIFGIGVDYSIFVTQGLLSDARGEQRDLLACHKSAIFFSAFVLVVVILSLLLARHPAIRSIGISSLIGMLTTILISYSLQPFLFRQLIKVPFFRKSMLR